MMVTQMTVAVKCPDGDGWDISTKLSDEKLSKTIRDGVIEALGTEAVSVDVSVGVAREM